jgi:fibronectin-binding autotransporter adhesin
VVSADATVLYNNSSTLPSGVNVADLIKAGNLTFDSVQSDGGTDTLHWNYDPHGANLDFLHAGDVLKITYTAQVSDGHGSYGSQQIAVTLVGTNSQTNVSALTVVDGTSGNDKFSNVGGNTTIFGNGGHDNFMFNPASGSATIADFDPSNDALTFASSMFNHNPANVLAAAHDDGHGNTVISLGGPDTITLQHVQASHLSASDFHFV